MKNLSLKQMENVEGGLSCYAECAACASTMCISGSAGLAVTGGLGLLWSFSCRL
jgi:hypothetical protein